MKPELAVLRLGYLSQELRARQRTVETQHLLGIKEVQPCLAEINQTLNMLGSRLSGYHRTAFVELRQRIAAHHEDLIEKRIGLAEGERHMPDDEDWADLQSLLRGVAVGDNNLDAWFVTGDHLGEVVFRLMENNLTIPLPAKQWDYLYQGVDRLPDPIRGRVEAAFPFRYRSRTHLGLQLVATFNSLCAILEDNRQVPYWDERVGKLWFGSILVKHLAKPAQSQRLALDAFQRKGWINKMLNPFRVGHTNLDAAIDACRQTADGLNDGHIPPKVIRFGHCGNGTFLTWQEIL